MSKASELYEARRMYVLRALIMILAYDDLTHHQRRILANLALNYFDILFPHDIDDIPF